MKQQIVSFRNGCIGKTKRFQGSFLNAERIASMPVRVKKFIFHFITTHRLKKYASHAGLRSSLQIMAKYKTSAIDPEKTIQFLIENTPEIEAHFHLFFPDLIEFVKHEKI